jgi:hypothetical protein
VDDGPVRLRSIASLIESRTFDDEGPLRQRVVKAANMLDGISTIVGSYLRNSPVFRLMFIFYLALLNFWVFYLFLTWNPEVHADQ